MYRVLTDYRIQNSRLFPKQYFFFRLKVIKQVINRDLKNTGTKLFSWVQVRLNKIQPKQKIFTHKALVVAYKKNFFPFFSTLPLLPDFFQVWKIAGQISRLFQKLKTLYEPCMPAEPFFCLVDFGVPKILHESSKISRLTSLEVCPVAVFFFFSLWCMDIVGKVDVGHYET